MTIIWERSMNNTFFDLEQKILQFGNILEDMSLLAEKQENPIVTDKILNVVTYYQFKYDDLWETFEKHSKELMNDK